MAYGAFTDRGSQPDDAEALARLGSALDHWQALVDIVSREYRATRFWRFYGRSYGWAVVYRARGRALLALFPGIGSLTALVVLPERCVSAAWSLEPALGEASAEALRTATPYKEGRWLFVAVETETDVGDVRRLVALKHPLVRSSV